MRSPHFRTGGTTEAKALVVAHHYSGRWPSVGPESPNSPPSFADSTQGHHGGIYQACSWHYDGKRQRRMDGVIVHGQFVPGRSANQTWGTQSPALLAERGIEAEPHYDEGKHLYWKPLNRGGKRKAKRLGLCDLPYPRPDDRSELLAGAA